MRCRCGYEALDGWDLDEHVEYMVSVLDDVDDHGEA